MIKLCSGCGLEREHAARADYPKKLRATCRECQAASTKAWRRRAWQRRKAYDTWKGMIARCHDPRTNRFWPGTGVPAYRDYGERGIKVCKRWRGAGGFLRFLEDVGLPPDPGCQLDRKRSALGYRPSNCRWASKAENDRNRRGVRVIEAISPITGAQLALAMAEWDRHLGLRAGTIGARLRRGWDEAGAISGVSPVQRELAAENVPF